MNLEEIFQFEYWLETGFAEILTGATGSVPVYDSSTRLQTMESPRIEVRAIVGSYVEHRHAFANTYTISQTGVPIETNKFAYDVYQATIEISVVTNRQLTEPVGAHRRLLGFVRSKMIWNKIIDSWNGNVLFPKDCRPLGTTDIIVNEDDLDVTVMQYGIVFTVASNVWPTDLN